MRKGQSYDYRAGKLWESWKTGHRPLGAGQEETA